MRTHAVVLGASMGGLLAARALADSFDTVTVLERDALASDTTTRRGVPQGVHIHVLLPSGSQLLERMYPGLLADLEADGVPVVRNLNRMTFALNDHTFCRDVPLPAPLYLASRPYLEAQVRERTPKNVTPRQGFAEGLSTDGARVRGVRLDGGAELAADLVVDATGRTGRTPTWLAEAGLPVPAEDRLDVDLAYVTAHLSMPDLPADFEVAFAAGSSPRRPWGIGLLRQERDLWLLTAYGYAGHHPPTDPDGLIALARQVMPDRWVEAVLGATWPEQLHRTRYPQAVRRRYDRMRDLPEGLVVVGDALSSFNPIYGQGMTLAALDAHALRKALRGPDQGLARRYYAASKSAVENAWQLASGGDLAYDTVPGPRPKHLTVLNGWVEQVLTTVERDPVVAAAFLDVAWLLAAPTKLFSPGVVARVAKDVRARRAS
ncbi:MAG: FAD-dependent oxidoreductase [Sporichthyaceae bacterium]